MHRMTPLTTAVRAYSSGGSRAVVEKVDDNPMMQEMKGGIMFGEQREKIESPQNYGFTSVVRDATKGGDGQIQESAEAYIMYPGGNRSFPVAAVMDDRRYRLKELKPGDTAFYDWQQQQFHFNEDGAFLTGLNDKKIRMQLSEPDQKQTTDDRQQQDPAKPKSLLALVQPLAGETAAAPATGGQGQQSGVRNGGQKARYKKESKQYIEVNKDKNEHMNKEHIFILQDGKTAVHIVEGQVYLGAKKGEAMFARVKTESGISVNVWAKIG